MADFFAATCFAATPKACANLLPAHAFGVAAQRVGLVLICLIAQSDFMHAQDGAKIITNSVGMKLTLIPAGKFVMGSPADEQERDPEERQHDVTITKPFYLGVHEVTQKQYEKVVGRNPSHFKQVDSDYPV